MPTVNVVLGNAQLTPQQLTLPGDWVGVDRGAFLLAQQNWHMRFAIGDFDSVNQVEFETIQLHAHQIIQLNADKDDSDFEAALSHLDDYDRIVVLGHWGDRFDHAYVNLQLLKRDPRIVFIDAHNQVQRVDEGEHIIHKNHYTYLSLFPLSEAMVSLSEVKYPLDKRSLNMKDLYTLSNEFKSDSCKLTVHQGQLLVILSKD